MYRIRLGKKTIGDNKVVNGDFSTGDLTGWEEAYGFYLKETETITPGTISYVNYLGDDAVQMTASSGAYLLIQRGILERGKEYRISFEILARNGNSEMGLKLGDWGKESYNALGVHTVDRLVLDRGDLVFNPFNLNIWTNISAFELAWNDPIEDEPINLIQISNSLTQSSDIEGLFVEFIEDLEFVGDGYRYLAAQRDEIGVNSVVPILIEESERGDFWHQRFEGTINISDIDFNESKKIARAKINDAGTPALLMQNMTTEVPMSPKYLYDVFEDYLASQPIHLQCNFFPSGASFPTIAYRIENAFAFVVNFITGSRALVYSDVFGDPDRYGNHLLAAVYNIISEEPDFKLSFRSLFEIINSVYNITIQFTRPENVPIVIITQKEDLETEDYSLTFTNARITSRKFIDNFAKDVKTGYQKKEDSGNQYNLFTFTANKVNVAGSELRLSPSNIYVEGAGDYSSADFSDGDNLLSDPDKTTDSTTFNNNGTPGGQEIINYYRPYISVFVNKAIINEDIVDYTFPLSNWISSLPFSFVGANNGVVQLFEKTNDAYLEEIQFEAPISKEAWNNLIFDTAGMQHVTDPCFGTSDLWNTFGDTQVNGDGRATINSYSQGAGFSNIFRNDLTPGKKYRVRVRMQGWSENADSLFSVAITDDTGDPNTSTGIGIIAPTLFNDGGDIYYLYDHIYDFFFELPVGATNLSGIGVFVFPDGASPSVNATFLQVDVFESKIIKNANKLIHVNGSPCKILEIEREINSGHARITALKKYENAN